MPFTASHAAAVLPLLRTGLPASALVIGSMAPDLPYYLPVAGTGLTHTALGVATVDVVIGAAAWALWHGLLAPPALAAAPASVRGRLGGRVRPGLRHRVDRAGQAVAAVVALAVGAATHVLWDEFSHSWGWGARHVDALAGDWGPLPGYAWVQVLSSVGGALLLLGWLVRWWRATPWHPVPRSATERWVWPLLGTVAVGVGIGAGAALRGSSFDAVTFAAATRAGGATLAVAVALAVAWHLRVAARRR